MGYFKKLTKGSTELTRALLGDPKPQKKHLGELAPGLRKEHAGDKFWTDMKDMTKQPEKNIGRHIWKPPLPNPVEPEVAKTPAAAPTPPTAGIAIRPPSANIDFVVNTSVIPTKPAAASFIFSKSKSASNHSNVLSPR